ncbi:hypothetical protein LPJ73_000436 [Coemansia sp. RSA 2703]|nr:hypothetical protein LPJ73_000436 [Coemansia sp. RSA 2703]
MDALGHLTTYAWNLYAYRLDRKFVWGFTVCDSIFRACLYSHDNVFVSDAMNVSTAKGRMQLVSLLVNMAFCDSSQLGYDPTIRYNPAVSEWEIDVYDDERQTTVIFWVDQVRPFEKTTFGNQARIIQCLKPGPSARADAENDESNYIYVKDSWAGCNELANDGDCDEIYALRKITNVLGSDTELEGTFPKLLSGGGVRQQIAENGSTLLETTDTLLAVLGGNVVKGITKRWQSGGNMWAGTFKQDVMSLDIMFGHEVIRNVITKNGYAPLENLVWYLYNSLFQNYNLTPMAHGTYILCPRKYNSIMEDLRQKQYQISPLSKHQHWDYNVGKDMIDPFERRQMFKNEIAENLLDIVHNAKAEALNRLATNS